MSLTLLLGAGSFIHAMRVIVLSLLLGNRDFGAVSTILLISALFAEFGSLGFSQLIYNQRLFTPGGIDRASVNVSRFLVAGLSIIVVMAVVVSLAVASLGPFQFTTLFLTLLCAATNTMLLAACRASKNKLTHPVGFFLKSIIVLIDIAILGTGHLNIESIALWGEILATPVLLIYVFRKMLIMPNLSLFRKVPGLLASNSRIAIWAVVSSMSSLIFFNQERIAGAIFLSLEQMGIITKMILIKIIAAQCAFIFGTYFHRHLIGCEMQERNDLFKKVRQYEYYIYAIVFAMCVVGSIPVQIVFGFVYGIEMDMVVTISAIVLAVIFFFNPFSILLQASGRFDLITRCNVIAVCLFLILATFRIDSAYLIIASAGASMIWYLLIRHAARKLV